MLLGSSQGPPCQTAAGTGRTLSLTLQDCGVRSRAFQICRVEHRAFLTFIIHAADRKSEVS